MVIWNAARTKVQLRLSVQRLRTLQSKKEALAKSTRRDIATLVERGKIETARIKVETLINDDIHVELLELLELYSELLLARFGLLELPSKEPDPGISEGVCSIIHAAPRTELKELQALREMLMHKYGREFSIAVMENRDHCVSDRVMSKLGVGTPPASLVDAYLGEIAKGYGLDWTPPPPAPQDGPSDLESKGDNDDTGGGGGLKLQKEEERELLKHVELSEKAESVKLPDLPSTDSRPSSTVPPPVTGDKAGEEEDELSSLTRRFAALRKR